MLSVSAATVPGNRPSTLSYLSRWASVSAVVMSLTATISRSGERSLAARNTLRPMRPKPLIPTLTPMRGTLQCQVIRRPLGARSPPITALTRRGDQTVEASGHGRTAAAGALRQLRQIVVRVADAKRRRLPQRRRQCLPAFGICLERGDGLELANPCARRPAQVGGLGVEPTVHAAPDLADHPPRFEREPAGLRADRAERRTDRRTGPHGDDPATAAAAGPWPDAEAREAPDQLGRATLVGATELEVGLSVGPHEPTRAEKRPAQAAPP